MDTYARNGMKDETFEIVTIGHPPPEHYAKLKGDGWGTIELEGNSAAGKICKKYFLLWQPISHLVMGASS